MQIQQFDHSNATSFKNSLEDRLKDINEEFGVAIKISNIKMQGKGAMNMTLTASVGANVKLEDTPSGRLFRAYCEAYGIPKYVLGQTVGINRTPYRIVGWAPSARKYCIEAERVSDGKIFRLDTVSVKRSLGL